MTNSHKLVKENSQTCEKKVTKNDKVVKKRSQTCVKKSKISEKQK